MSFDAKYDMWTYFVWNSVKWKYWNDTCRENEMLAYVVRSLIKVNLSLDAPWCETCIVNLFGFIFGKMKVLEWLCRENEILAYMVRSLINSELVPRCPLMRNMICEPIWFYIRKNESIGMTLSRKWDFSLYG
jgi:hypothetical protein